MPSATSVWQVSITCSTIVGASPSEGSSMISSVGFVSSARPIASICCSPPESCVALILLALGEAREELVDRRRRSSARRTRGARIIFRCSSVESDWKSRRPCGT